MLTEVLKNLDNWVIEENRARSARAVLLLPEVQIRVIGQTALIEANLNLEIVATMDVDLIDQIEHTVKQKFEELLKVYGKTLDPVGHEAWMPAETEYHEIFKGEWIAGSLAKPVFIILSKAKFAPEKNGNLIADYLASDALDIRIFDLAEKYKVDLDQFV
jgi:hypothetical protein